MRMHLDHFPIWLFKWIIIQEAREIGYKGVRLDTLPAARWSCDKLCFHHWVGFYPSQIWSRGKTDQRGTVRIIKWEWCKISLSLRKNIVRIISFLKVLHPLVAHLNIFSHHCGFHFSNLSFQIRIPLESFDIRILCTHIRQKLQHRM